MGLEPTTPRTTKEVVTAPGKLWQPTVFVDVPHRVERPCAVCEEFLVRRS